MEQRKGSSQRERLAPPQRQRQIPAGHSDPGRLQVFSGPTPVCLTPTPSPLHSRPETEGIADSGVDEVAFLVEGLCHPIAWEEDSVTDVGTDITGDPPIQAALADSRSTGV